MVTLDSLEQGLSRQGQRRPSCCHLNLVSEIDIPPIFLSRFLRLNFSGFGCVLQIGHTLGVSHYALATCLDITLHLCLLSQLTHRLSSQKVRLFHKLNLLLLHLHLKYIFGRNRRFEFLIWRKRTEDWIKIIRRVLELGVIFTKPPLYIAGLLIDLRVSPVSLSGRFDRNSWLEMVHCHGLGAHFFGLWFFNFVQLEAV